MKASKILALSFLILAASCDKAKQRPEVINTAIESKVVEVSKIHDVSTENTSRAYFYKENSVTSLSKEDKTVQIKIDAEVSKILNLVQKDDTKKELEDQLKSGLIAFMILPDQIKIYKVLNEQDLLAEKKSNLALDLSALVEMKRNLAVNPKMQVVEKESSAKTKFVEITSIKIEKAGVLENDKTKYYEEKMSVLTVAERPLDLSTHILLKEENKDADPAIKAAE